MIDRRACALRSFNRMANGTMEQGKKPYFWQRKYFIDKRFQGKFVLRYSIVVAISAVIVLGALFALKNKAYTLLPDGASVLAQMDVDNHKSLKKDKCYIYNFYTLICLIFIHIIN